MSMSLRAVDNPVKAWLKQKRAEAICHGCGVAAIATTASP